MIVDIEDDIMDPVMQCTTLPSHSGGSLLQPQITKTKMKMEILLEPTSNKTSWFGGRCKVLYEVQSCAIGISQNFSSPYTPEQNGVAERKNKTLIEAAITMMNGLVLSKHLWTEAVGIDCYTQNRSIIIKRHDKTPYEIFKERILDISYFNVFGCHVFIHNHKDHLGKFEAKANDGYFLGYSFVSKAFRFLKHIKTTTLRRPYPCSFDKSMEPIRFTNILVDEIGINESSRYPPDEYLHEDDPSRQY
ncbi:retrovirus-related pol polyprotein from transposon TNT 1-94 [Tanacetum coccineum]